MTLSKTLKATFLAAAVTASGSNSALAQDHTTDQPLADNNEASQLQMQVGPYQVQLERVSRPEVEMTPVHEATGCEAYASSEGIIQIACFGNPYQGDPNPGMIIDVDLNANQMTVENRYEITADGQLNELEDPNIQTYPLSFTKDVKEANKMAEKIGLELPSQLEMGDAYRNKNDETGLFSLQSDSGKLSVTMYDTGKISEGLGIATYYNLDDGSITRLTVTPNKVVVQTGQPGETQSISMVDIGKASFTPADFRNTAKAAPRAPKKPSPGGV